MEKLNRYVDNSVFAIIDDSDTCLYVIKAWLVEKYNSLKIKTYNKPEDFIKDFKNNKEIDCLIIDYYLETTIAPNVIKEIRKLSKDLLIITTSSNFNSTSIICKETKEALLAGSNRVSEKDPHALELIISTHFGVRKMKEDIYSLVGIA